MNKLILPILCGIFVLCFSGTPATKQNNFSATLNIRNVAGGVGTIGVTSVVVHNFTTGVTTTYNNPTFPFNHNDQEGAIDVTYNFNGTYTGCWVTSPPCNAGGFTSQTSITLGVDAVDGEFYTVQISPRAPSQPCFQCAP